MNEIRDLMDIGQLAAEAAGKVIMEAFRSRQFERTLKEFDLPVTKADRDSQEMISRWLERTGLPVLSEEAIQMDYSVRKNWPLYWIIDPLDGTEEFISGKTDFTVNIALIKDTSPVAGIIHVPVRSITYTGSKGTVVCRSEKGKAEYLKPLDERIKFSDLLKKETVCVVASHSYMNAETEDFIRLLPHPVKKSMGSSLKFIMLMENQADIYPRLSRTMEWDTAAAHALMNVSNRGLYQMDLKTELVYNKPDLSNPFFVAF